VFFIHNKMYNLYYFNLKKKLYMTYKHASYNFYLLTIIQNKYTFGLFLTSF